MDRRYESIIDLPHYEPKRHKRMSSIERAAQFSPFAALTGYSAVIEGAGESFEAEDLRYLDEDESWYRGPEAEE